LQIYDPVTAASQKTVTALTPVAENNSSLNRSWVLLLAIYSLLVKTSTTEFTNKSCAFFLQSVNVHEFRVILTITAALTCSFKTSGFHVRNNYILHTTLY